MLFISHAVADKPVVEDLFTLLQTGAGLALEEAFVSSVSGAGIPSGGKFVDEILQALTNADLVVLIITPNYYASRFCIAELGGAWALGKTVFPLVGPDVDREIGANMLGTQTERVDATGLNRLFDCLKGVLPARKWDTDRWELMRDEFLTKFADKYPKLPQPSTVDRAVLEKEQARARTAMDLRGESEAEITRLREYIALLEKAKDATEVRELKRQFDTEQAQYEALLNEVRTTLRKHESVVIRCIYASMNGESWQPSVYAWDTMRTDLDRALSGERIIANDRHEPDRLWANDEHPGLRPAFAALHALAHFLGEDATPEMVNALEEEYEIPVRMTNREYWEDVLLDGTELPE